MKLHIERGDLIKITRESGKFLIGVVTSAVDWAPQAAPNTDWQVAYYTFESGPCFYREQIDHVVIEKLQSWQDQTYKPRDEIILISGTNEYLEGKVIECKMGGSVLNPSWEILFEIKGSHGFRLWVNPVQSHLAVAVW